MSALKNNQPGPPELSEFRLQEAFWTRFGVKLDELDNWPLQKVNDFIEIMNIEAQIQKDNSAQASGEQSTSQLQAAYEALKLKQAAEG